MRPAGQSSSRSRRALVVALPLFVAALCWIVWRIASDRGTPVEVAPARASEPHPPAHAPAAPLEIPSSERVSGERIAELPVAPLESVPQPAPATGGSRKGPWIYRGLVVDLDFDQPLAGATLVFEAQAPASAELFRTQSDEHGRFVTPALSAEAHGLRVEPPEGYVCDEPRSELGARRGDILVTLHRDPRTLAGAIRGELQRESGPWTAETLPKPNTVMIDLVPTDGQRWSRRAEITSEPDEHGNVRLRFEFDRLPRGEYELTLSSLAAFRWSPVSMRVSPPIENVLFVRYDLDRATALVFHVRDAQTGATIETFDVRSLQLTPLRDNGVFLHTGPFETKSVPEQARFQWSLSAEGYRPAFGDETAFVRQGGERVASVQLERGWATKVLVLLRDPAAKPAARAEVWLDGRSQGFTDENGTLVLSAPKPPEKLEVRYAGWKMSNDPLQPYNGKAAAQRGQVTIVMLEKEK